MAPLETVELEGPTEPECWELSELKIELVEDEDVRLVSGFVGSNVDDNWAIEAAEDALEAKVEFRRLDDIAPDVGKPTAWLPRFEL